MFVCAVGFTKWIPSTQIFAPLFFLYFSQCKPTTNRSQSIDLCDANQLLLLLLLLSPTVESKVRCQPLSFEPANNRSRKLSALQLADSSQQPETGDQTSCCSHSYSNSCFSYPHTHTHSMPETASEPHARFVLFFLVVVVVQLL